MSEKVERALGGGTDKKSKVVELLKDNSERIAEISKKVCDDFKNEIENRKTNKALRYNINDNGNGTPFRI